MSTITLDAEIRANVGKGASRRLRRFENKIPAILYGGDKKSEMLSISHNKMNKALENESIYSNMFNLNIEGKIEHVILKSLQHHPYKPIILHMDLQRVSAKDVLIKSIPLHFTNEQICKAIKAGGIVTHAMTQIEIRCQAKNLPDFIAVDMGNVAMNQVLHLSDVVLPKGVELTVDLTDGTHNLPVASIHSPKIELEESAAETAVESEEKQAFQEENEEK